MNSTRNTIRRVVDFYHDRIYFQDLYKLAAPISLQNLLTASLGMVGNVMLGQLGDVPMAAAALAGQIFFLLSLILFGTASGSAMFTAQLWGKKDITNLHKVFGLCLTFGLLIAVVIFLLSEFIPEQLMGIFTTDPQVIAQGSVYLRIYAWGFLFFSITSGFAAVLRSVGDVKLPLVVSVSALALNIILNYGLIFGKFGLPALGLKGAAISTVTARMIECLALVAATYWKKSPVAAGMHELLGFDLRFTGKIFKPVLPVILNELFWSLAITTYNVVYARIGTTSMAAMNIVATIDNLALVPFMGISNAIAIMVGNKIGAGEEKEAYRYVGRALGITVLVAILVGVFVLTIKEPVLSLYQVSEEAIRSADRALLILALCMWIRSQNMLLILGAFRSGGDTRFSLILDGFIIWILGVPMAVLGGLVLHLPVYWVYLMVMSEEFTKWIIGLWRYSTRKWIHNLTHTVTAPSPTAE